MVDGESVADEECGAKLAALKERLRQSPVTPIEVRFLTEILDDFRRFVDEIWRF